MMSWTLKLDQGEGVKKTQSHPSARGTRGKQGQNTPRTNLWIESPLYFRSFFFSYRW